LGSSSFSDAKKRAKGQGERGSGKHLDQPALPQLSEGRKETRKNGVINNNTCARRNIGAEGGGWIRSPSSSIGRGGQRGRSGGVHLGGGAKQPDNET